MTQWFADARYLELQGRGAEVEPLSPVWMDDLLWAALAEVEADEDLAAELRRKLGG